MSLVYKFGYPPHFVLNFECPLIAVHPHDSASVDFAVDLAAMYPVPYFWHSIRGVYSRLCCWFAFLPPRVPCAFATWPWHPWFPTNLHYLSISCSSQFKCKNLYEEGSFISMLAYASLKWAVPSVISLHSSVKRISLFWDSLAGIRIQ